MLGFFGTVNVIDYVPQAKGSCLRPRGQTVALLRGCVRSRLGAWPHRVLFGDAADNQRSPTHHCQGQLVGTRRALALFMLEKWKDAWGELAHDSPGQRFTHLYERQHANGSRGLSWLYILGALLCIAIGVVLVFIPGPAFVFFILAGGLMATQSRWLAQRLDRGEVAITKWWKRWRGTGKPGQLENRS
jgi:hypothetical protein